MKTHYDNPEKEKFVNNLMKFSGYSRKAAEIRYEKDQEEKRKQEEQKVEENMVKTITEPIGE